jgi:hypothetical protein
MEALRSSEARVNIYQSSSYNLGDWSFISQMFLFQQNVFLECHTVLMLLFGKGKAHPFTGTEAMYRPYGPYGW